MKRRKGKPFGEMSKAELEDELVRTWEALDKLRDFNDSIRLESDQAEAYVKELTKDVKL